VSGNINNTLSQNPFACCFPQSSNLSLIWFDSLPLWQWFVTGHSIHRYFFKTSFYGAKQFFLVLAGQWDWQPASFRDSEMCAYPSFQILSGSLEFAS